MKEWQYLLTKILVRLILYGLSVVCAWAGIPKDEAEPAAAELAAWAVSAVAALVAIAADKWFQNRDLAAHPSHRNP